MSELYDDPDEQPAEASGQLLEPVAIVITNLPDADSARQIATELVQDKLAACANVMSPCTSIFCWEGQLQQDSEIPVWFKTTRFQAPLLVQALQARHPYDVPEILTMMLNDVASSYASWVAAAVRP